MSNVALKKFRVFLKGRPPIVVEAFRIGKIMEGMVVFHATDGEVAAAFTVNETIGVVDVTVATEE